MADGRRPQDVSLGRLCPGGSVKTFVVTVGHAVKDAAGLSLAMNCVGEPNRWMVSLAFFFLSTYLEFLSEAKQSRKATRC